MDFNDSPDQAQWRQQVRTFLESETPERPRGGWLMANGQRTAEYDQLRDKLVTRGWIAPAWPKEYGGAGMGVMEQFIMNEEFAEARVPGVGGSGVSMIGPTLIEHGTDDQKEEHLSRILRGEVQWCQGYSEPGSGSDLASLQTRAVRDGDDFVLNGQKIWTSGAHNADWMFMLARTDPEAPKHRGISYFLLDMKSPGINVRPLINMANNHGFNEVFFEDVRVPARNVIGEINRGWYVGTTTLDFERSSIGNAVGQRQSLEGYLRAIAERAEPIPAAVKSEWSDRWIEASVAKLFSYRVISIQASGRVPNSEASIAKLYNSELGQRVARTAMRTFGMAGQLRDGEHAPMRGMPAGSYMQTVASTIAGGTSEIQRNIVATRGLGLPRG